MDVLRDHRTGDLWQLDPDLLRRRKLLLEPAPQHASQGRVDDPAGLLHRPSRLTSGQDLLRLPSQHERCLLPCDERLLLQLQDLG